MNVNEGGNNTKEDVSPRMACVTYADTGPLPDWFMEVRISCHGSLPRPYQAFVLVYAECFCVTLISLPLGH